MPKAMIERKDMTYLYNDGDLYNFMDAETYDQIAIPASEVGDALKFVKENENVKVLSHNGNIFGIEPPLFVELEVTELNQVSRAILQQVLLSQLLLKQVLRLMYLFSSIRVKSSRLILELVNT